LITFGIITNESKNNHLKSVISSIILQNIPDEKYEIIIVGNTDVQPRINLRIIQFDESVVPNWITRKKNIIIENAKFEHIVFLHDYVVFDKNWFKEFQTAKKDFEVAVCRIENFDGTRFRDWQLWVENSFPYDSYLQRSRECLLPYFAQSFSKYIYISGTFWIAKKDFMKNHKLNENLSWGQSEDVEWSKRIREVTKIKLLKDLRVQLLKQKDVEYRKVSPLLLLSLYLYRITSRPFYIKNLNRRYNI
jgi:hypothetical protein